MVVDAVLLLIDLDTIDAAFELCDRKMRKLDDTSMIVVYNRHEQKLLQPRTRTRPQNGLVLQVYPHP